MCIAPRPRSNPTSCVLDPFVGAGTTLLAAKEKGVPATGYDLLPLSVLVANTKVANYSLLRLKREWEMLMATRKVRYQSIQSHPEAHPVRPETKEYRRPEKLKEVIEELNEVAKDIRIPTMIDSYFLDIYICLRKMIVFANPEQESHLWWVMRNTMVYRSAGSIFGDQSLPFFLSFGFRHKENPHFVF